jgi:hypothetical protein
MNIFLEEHLDMIRSLISNKVEFLLIGGFAVNFYGVTRTTGDLDIWISSTGENKLKLLTALEQFELDDESIKHMRELDFMQPTVFHIGNVSPFIFDFLTKIVGVHWEEAWNKKVIYSYENMDIPFIHLSHLKINKLMSGRLKDLDDISMLNRFEDLKDK